MRVLVAGLLHAGSGKTVLAVSLVRALVKEGFVAAASKPLGATDLMCHPDIIARTRETRVILTWDGYVLHKASGERLPVEVVNPIGALLAPVLLSRHGGWSSYETTLSEPYRRAVLVRATACAGESRSVHFVNSDALMRTNRYVGEAIEELALYLNPPPVKAGDEAVSGLFSGGGAATADTCLALAEASSDVLVVESNSNVAAPTLRSAYPDIAVVVGYGEAYLVDGERFSRALEALALSGRPWVASSSEVLMLTGSSERVELPLLEDPDEGYPQDILQPVVERVKGLSARRRSSSL